MRVPTTTLTKAWTRFTNGLRLTSAPHHADHAIVRRLTRAFEARRDFDGLRFYVKQGVVTIFGTLDTSSQQAILEGSVRSIPGVLGVHLHVLLVHADVPEALPSLAGTAEAVSGEPVAKRARPMRRRRARLAIAGG